MGHFFPCHLREAKEIVVGMRSRTSFFVVGLTHPSSKESQITMLIGDMDSIRLMIHAQQVEEDQLTDR